jgi:hypothetical protein
VQRLFINGRPDDEFNPIPHRDDTVAERDGVGQDRSERAGFGTRRGKAQEALQNPRL